MELVKRRTDGLTLGRSIINWPPLNFSVYVRGGGDVSSRRRDNGENGTSMEITSAVGHRFSANIELFIPAYTSHPLFPIPGYSTILFACLCVARGEKSRVYAPIFATDVK